MQTGISRDKKQLKPSRVCCSYFLLPEQTCEVSKACPVAAQRRVQRSQGSLGVLGKPTEGAVLVSSVSGRPWHPQNPLFWKIQNQ